MGRGVVTGSPVPRRETGGSPGGKHGCELLDLVTERTRLGVDRNGKVSETIVLYLSLKTLKVPEWVTDPIDS